MIPTASDWERMWAPYDPSTYRQVLEHITPSDVVCEIGAGDLRLARQIASRARHVYAIEIDPNILAAGANPPQTTPDNLSVICADARHVSFPACVTIGVLLMRHCTSFKLYAEKLRHTGCRWLLTNARWGMGVESVDLEMPRIAYSQVPMGWYACWCGAVGFKLGPAEEWTAERDGIVWEILACPSCKNRNLQGVDL